MYGDKRKSIIQEQEMKESVPTAHVSGQEHDGGQVTTVEESAYNWDPEVPTGRRGTVTFEEKEEAPAPKATSGNKYAP